MGPTGSAIEEIKLYTGTLPNGNPTDTYFLREIILPGQESWGYEWTIISCEIKHGYWLGPGSVGPIAFRYCYSPGNVRIVSNENLNNVKYRIVVMRCK